ncbi:MAG: crotonase/enoyl-CoA hydratase family protein [Candidatus Binatia bacterium]
MSYEDIRYAVQDRVATITLHRPERMNAFTPRMCHELLHALDAADADDDVRVVIVTGEGRAFCAGADLGSGGKTFDGGAQGSKQTIDSHRDEGGLVSLKIHSLKKPVIGAINGSAVGVGITMTLPMDIRIAAEGAKIGFVFARRGIVPEAASSWFLPRIVGIQQAAEWVFTGRVFDAAEAHAAGLVSRVLPADQVVSAARTLAREIAENTSAVSVALSRQLLWRMLGASSPMEAHLLDSKSIFFMGRSADAYEGVSSFLEKRPPKFSMRPSADMPPFYPWWKE